MKLITGVSALLLGMCPTSPAPISNVAQAPFDQALVGKWAATGKNDDGDTLVVLEFRSPEYYVEYADPTPGKPAEPPFRGRAYISKIGGASIMNVQELSVGKSGYMFYRFRIAGDTLVVNGFKDAVYKFHSTAELRRYLARNVASGSLYDEDARFIRVRK